MTSTWANAAPSRRPSRCSTAAHISRMAIVRTTAPASRTTTPKPTAADLSGPARASGSASRSSAKIWRTRSSIRVRIRWRRYRAVAGACRATRRSHPRQVLGEIFNADARFDPNTVTFRLYREGHRRFGRARLGGRLHEVSRPPSCAPPMLIVGDAGVVARIGHFARVPAVSSFMRT